MFNFVVMEAKSAVPVNFTVSAINEIKKLIGQDNFDPTQILRVGVKGGGCSGLSYVLGFDHKGDNDSEFEVNGIRCIIDKAHEIYLIGMQIDWENGLNNRGFAFKNPNASTTCGCGTSFAV